MTGLDVGIEANVGANPSGTKFGGIPHGNPAGIAGTGWLEMTGTDDEAISEMTFL